MRFERDGTLARGTGGSPNRHPDEGVRGWADLLGSCTADGQRSGSTGFACALETRLGATGHRIESARPAGIAGSATSPSCAYRGQVGTAGLSRIVGPDRIIPPDHWVGPQDWAHSGGAGPHLARQDCAQSRATALAGLQGRDAEVGQDAGQVAQPGPDHGVTAGCRSPDCRTPTTKRHGEANSRVRQVAPASSSRGWPGRGWEGRLGRIRLGGSQKLGRRATPGLGAGARAGAGAGAGARARARARARAQDRSLGWEAGAADKGRTGSPGQDPIAVRPRNFRARACYGFTEGCKHLADHWPLLNHTGHLRHSGNLLDFSRSTSRFVAFTGRRLMFCLAPRRPKQPPRCTRM